MKYYMLIVLFICINIFSKLYAQEDDKSQKTIEKLQINAGYVNGVDITPRLIEEKAFIAFYQIGETDQLYMANYHDTSNTQSFGTLYAVEKENIEESEESYKALIFNFQWTYVNSYDEDSGNAKVELIKVYKPQGVYFKITIVPENLDILVYKGYVEGTLDLDVYENKN